jgi:hypothetical protein
MVDRLHIHTQIRMMKLLAIALSRVGKGSRRGDGRDDLMFSVSLFGIVIGNLPCMMNIS